MRFLYCINFALALFLMPAFLVAVDPEGSGDDGDQKVLDYLVIDSNVMARNPWVCLENLDCVLLHNMKKIRLRSGVRVIFFGEGF